MRGARDTGAANDKRDRRQRARRGADRAGAAGAAARAAHRACRRGGEAGGLESFAARWAADARAARARGEAPPAATQADGKAPEEAFARLFSNYAALDPMQRTARVRAALALLDGMHSDSRTSAAAGTAMPRTPPSPPPHPPPAPAQPRQPPAFGTTAAKPGRNGRNGKRDETAEPWPLATPPPTLTVVKGRRAEENGHAHDDERERPRAEDEHLLRAPVTAIPGVGPTQAARLERLGIKTVRELLFTFPREHRDYSKLEKIGMLPFDEVCTVLGMITEVQNTRTGGGRIRTVARIYDETGAIRATWFNQPYLLKQLPRGAYIVVTGVKKRFGNSVEFGVQSHELPEQGDLINTGRLVPVYPLTEGLHPKVMRRITKWAVDHCAAFVPEHLPAGPALAGAAAAAARGCRADALPRRRTGARRGAAAAGLRRALPDPARHADQARALAGWPARPGAARARVADLRGCRQATIRYIRHGHGRGARRWTLAAHGVVLRADAAVPAHRRAAARHPRDPGGHGGDAGHVPAAAGRCWLRQDGGGGGGAAGLRGERLSGRDCWRRRKYWRSSTARGVTRAARAVRPARRVADGQPAREGARRRRAMRWRTARRRWPSARTR